MTIEGRWRGNLDATGDVFKFGANPAITTAYEDVWDSGATYTWLAAATAVQVSSSAVADDAAGTGALTMRVEGLAATTYLETSEDFTLDGRTPVTGSVSFIRVHRAYCLTAGSGAVNAGDLYVSTTGAAHTNGVPNTASEIHAKIIAGNGQTLMAIYTVPADFSNAILTSISAGSDDNAKTMTYQMMARPDGGVWRVQWQQPVVGAAATHPFTVPIQFAAKTDLRLRAISSTGTHAASGDFSMLML